MAACTFLGHAECYGFDERALRQAIEDLINKGVDTFYMGNQGQFDSTVYSCLKQLQKNIPTSGSAWSWLTSLPQPANMMTWPILCTRRSRAIPNLPSSAATAG